MQGSMWKPRVQLKPINTILIPSLNSKRLKSFNIRDFTEMLKCILFSVPFRIISVGLLFHVMPLAQTEVSCKNKIHIILTQVLLTCSSLTLYSACTCS